MSGNVLAQPADLGVLAAFEDEALPASLDDLLEPGDFRGSVGQMRLLYPRAAVAPRRLLLIGLGKQDTLTADGLRQAAASAIRQARDLQVSAVSLGIYGEPPLDSHLVGQALAEGIELGTYRYLHYRTGLTAEQSFDVTDATLYAGDANEAGLRAGAEAGMAIASGVVLARDLVNRPGYAKTPAALADEAVALGERTGLKVKVFDKDELTEQGFGGILAVGQGSSNDPRFIIMEHGVPGDGPTICLVGKGLTFDSGGLSLKPADAMITMKNDMAGAAAVFGAMQVVAELNLPLHVVGLVSAAENMPSGTAYRPGDIVRTLSGKTVEVVNTDAEGRIILADALFYAHRYDPEAIIELSTLTGAIIIALASHATGMMATDQALADKISRAGDA